MTVRKALPQDEVSVSHVTIALRNIIVAVALAVYLSGGSYHCETGHSQPIFCAKKHSELCLFICARSSAIMTEV